MSDRDCVFCAIVDGEAPAYRVYEDDRTVAFLDVAPVARGHTLVVPKGHAADLADADPDAAGAVFAAASRVAGALAAVLDPDGLSVYQASGAAAGQEVFHLHVHLVPRNEGDDVGFRWPRHELTDAEGESVAASLRAALD